MPTEWVLSVQNANPAVRVAMIGPGAPGSPATGTMAGWDLTSRLPEVRIPTLVTVGRRDFITPKCAETIHRGIPGSQLVVFEDSGHDALYKQRDLYVETVRQFLSGVAK